MRRISLREREYARGISSAKNKSCKYVELLKLDLDIQCVGGVKLNYIIQRRNDVL